MWIRQTRKLDIEILPKKDEWENKQLESMGFKKNEAGNYMSVVYIEITPKYEAKLHGYNEQGESI